MSLKITEDHVALPRWLGVAIVIGAFLVGGVVVEGRLRLADLEQQTSRNAFAIETHSNLDGHRAALARIDRLERTTDQTLDALKRIDRTMVKICEKLRIECPD